MILSKGRTIKTTKSAAGNGRFGVHKSKSKRHIQKHGANEEWNLNLN